MSATETGLPYLPKFTVGDLCAVGRLVERNGWHGTGEWLANAPVGDDIDAVPREPRGADGPKLFDGIIQAVLDAPPGEPVVFGPPAMDVEVRSAPEWKLDTTFLLYCEAVVGLGGRWEWVEVATSASNPNGFRVETTPCAIYVLDGNRRAVVVPMRSSSSLSEHSAGEDR